MRVAVFAREEMAQTLMKAFHAFPAAEVFALPWPPVQPIADPDSADKADAVPDLVVCEIDDVRQAHDRCLMLHSVWPETMIVSCEKGINGFDLAPGSLLTAAREAGYHGHVTIAEASLHLPFFLRYAAQRRQIEAKLEQTEVRLKRLEQIFNAFSQILISLDLQRVAARIIEEFSRYIPADAWLLYAMSGNSESLELVLAEGMRIRPHSLKLAMVSSLIENEALRPGKMEAINQAGAVTDQSDTVPESNVAENHGQPQPVAFCLPLTVENKAVGLIEAIRHSGSFEIPDEQLLSELSRIASLALNNALRYERAERMYMQDDLTTLHNSRYLRQFIEREIKRARRYGSEFSVVFIDIDGFKQVNDRLGHRVGSETLCEIAELLAGSVRETDVVARYGGDEFSIVLPETSAEQALNTAERIRRKICDRTFSGGSAHNFHLTVSLGVASFPTHAESAAELLEKADLAMYEAKAASKNNVKLSQ